MINAHLGTGILYHCGLYPTPRTLTIGDEKHSNWDTHPSELDGLWMA